MMIRLLCVFFFLLSLCACASGELSAAGAASSPADAEGQGSSSISVLPQDLPSGSSSQAQQIQEDDPSASAPADAGGSLWETASEAEAAAATSPLQEGSALKITAGQYEFRATFEENSSAEEFRDLLAQGPVTIVMEDYGGFEKVGPLGTELSRNDMQITTQPGDVILYQGDQITLYYGTNSWTFTRLARIDNPSGLREKLGDGTVEVTFSLESLQ